MHKRTASNPNELKQCCKKEWAKTHPLWRERLINYTAKIYLKLMLLQMLLQAIEMWVYLVFTGLWNHFFITWLCADWMLFTLSYLYQSWEWQWKIFSSHHTFHSNHGPVDSGFLSKVRRKWWRRKALSVSKLSSQLQTTQVSQVSPTSPQTQETCFLF